MKFENLYLEVNGKRNGEQSLKIQVDIKTHIRLLLLVPFIPFSNDF